MALTLRNVVLPVQRTVATLGIRPLSVICPQIAPVWQMSPHHRHIPLMSPISYQMRCFAAVRPKRKKDPDAPKRPMSAYFRFLGEFRQKNSNLPHKEVVSKAGVEWKGLSEHDKKPFQDAYEKDRSTYKSELEEYTSSGKKDAWLRDPNKPKIPMTAFLRFASEYRGKHPDLKMTEATKAAGQEWKVMSTESKAPYENAYQEAKAQYVEQKKAYDASGMQAEWEKKVGLADKKKPKLTKETKEKIRAAKKLADVKRKALTEKKKKAAEAIKKKEQAEKKKAAALKKKIADAKKAADAATAKKKKAAADKKKKAAAEKKKLAALKKKLAAAKKSADATRKAVQDKKNKAAAIKKKKADDEKKKAATIKKKILEAKKLADSTRGAKLKALRESTKGAKLKKAKN